MLRRRFLSTSASALGALVAAPIATLIPGRKQAFYLGGSTSTIAVSPTLGDDIMKCRSVLDRVAHLPLREAVIEAERILKAEGIRKVT